MVNYIIFLFILCLTGIISAIEKEKYLLPSGKSVDVCKSVVLVKYKENFGSHSKMEFHKKYGINVIKEIKIRDNIVYQILKLPEGMSVNEGVNIYSNYDEVDIVSPDGIRHALAIPNDPRYSEQWGLRAIHLEEAWDIVTGSPSVIVAVIDTGVDRTHPDLAGNVLTDIDRDFVNNDDDAMDDEGHGTHVAGIISAVTNNSLGIAGVSWNSKILPVKVLDQNGEGSDSNIAQGILWAVEKGAKIINMSFGDTAYPPWYSFIVYDACSYAYNNGVVLVAASGNGYDNDGNGIPETFDMVTYPAAFDFCIAVGACDVTGNRASFSNYGPELDLIAPGTNILSTYRGGGYTTMNGTSMATPFVSGVIALLLSENPGLTLNIIKDSLFVTCDDSGLPGYDIYTGRGRINAYQAVLYRTPPAVSKVLNYPNPFNPVKGEKTHIAVPSEIYASKMIVTVYNIAGEVIRTLDLPGEVENTFAIWDGKNDNGEVVANGIYFYIVKNVTGQIAKGKISVLKR